MLDGLPGVLCMMDDIIISGDFREEHDARAKAGLKRLEENRVTLNSGKCDSAKSNVSYIGHMSLSQGIEADLANVQAIMEMEQPTDVGDIRRFISKTNQLGKISPKLATITKPLRDLLSKQNQWTWGQSQAHAFEEVKREHSHTPVLALYVPNLETTVSAIASSFGLGTVLLQRHDETMRPVAYASRAMTATEQRYFQIDKEALLTTRSLVKFSDDLYRMQFHVETYLKPLKSVLSSKKNLDELSPRIQRFRMRLMQYAHTISHVPGKNLVAADALSRSPSVRPLTADESQFAEEVSEQADLVMGQIIATETRFEEIRANNRRTKYVAK